MTKLLFLPNCLRDEDYNLIFSEATKKDYEVYQVSGGSRVKKILEDYNLDKVEKIVGIACMDEIKLAENLAGMLGIEEKIITFPLNEEGCINTGVDVKGLLEKL